MFFIKFPYLVIVFIYMCNMSTPGESEFQFEILFIMLLNLKLDSKILKIFYLIK